MVATEISNLYLWAKITSDPEILQKVKGLTLESIEENFY